MAASWQERMQVGAAYDNGAWKWLRERGGSAWHRLVLCSRRMRRVAVGMLAVFLVCVGAFAWSWNTTPAVGSLDDQVQGEVAAHHAPYTAYNDISPLLVEALIAAEDEHFYAHHGIDVMGLTRAAWDDLWAGRIVEGGSTLTEQLAKNAYLHGDDHTLWKKWQDMVLALKIEQHYNKRQILELYLNLVYFGDGAYGIGAASEHYFGVSPARLDLAQAALLAGLVRAPSLYDPLCNPAAARARQDDVLMRMVSDGMITQAQARAAQNEALPHVTAPHDTFC